MKLIAIMIYFLFHFQLFASDPNILIINKTSSEIKFTHTYLNLNDRILIQDKILKSQEIYNGSTSRYAINNNYFLEFRDTHIECSWLSTLRIRHANGWGIQLFINGQEVVTICANKYSVFDYQNHAELSYIVDHNNEEKLIFKNIGWWRQANVFSIEKEIPLTKYKKNFLTMKYFYLLLLEVSRINKK